MSETIEVKKTSEELFRDQVIDAAQVIVRAGRGLGSFTLPFEYVSFVTPNNTLLGCPINWQMNVAMGLAISAPDEAGNVLEVPFKSVTKKSDYETIDGHEVTDSELAEADICLMHSLHLEECLKNYSKALLNSDKEAADKIKIKLDAHAEMMNIKLAPKADPIIESL